MKKYTHITTYIEGGRRYEIIKDGKWYFGIEDVHIDKEGRLIHQLNGFQAKTSESVEDVIELIKAEVAIDKLEAQGIDRMVASLMYFYKADRATAEEARSKMNI